jgi:natural product precursor
MKKIGKISINPEKVIKNEELVNLKGGGYGGGGPCTCTCFNSSTFECYGYVFAPDGNCPSYCSDFYYGDGNITGECGTPPSCL